ncbi:MAG: electron transfer flavoprotein subunit beta/FixA family protein [Bacteroidia bacterium]
MNILVCISAVPDTTTKISFTDNNTKFNTDGVQFIINPYDEMALSKALELTEANGGEVTVICVGDASTEPVIRKALAIGAHNAIRINTVAKDGLHVAKCIAQAISGKSFDIIFTGRESIDYNGGQVAGLLSSLLDVALINVVSKIEVSGNEVTAVRDIDGGRETVSCHMPCVISAQKDLCEVRIPNMRGIMMARSKPLEVIEPSEDYTLTAYNEYELPVSKQGVKMIDPANAGELMDLLRTEKKFI